MSTATPPAVEPPVRPLAALDRTALPLAGGKAANLGELLQAGLPVPDGFCVTTAAYRRMAELAGLDRVLAAPVDGLTELANRARAALLAAPVPDDLAEAIVAAYDALGGGEAVPVAVRSSATAEDLPEASFAGQQETSLNVVGREALLDAVRRCWASLWTDRAVAYRAANGIEQETVRLAVVVQRMVPARVAGVLFTANPLTGRRTETVIEAAPGLGEAVVSGAVNPDHVVVDRWRGQIVARRPGDRPCPTGGAADGLCLTEAEIAALVRLGQTVEAHYGAPQDLEWAFDPDGRLWLLQARPITTLYPLPPDAPRDPEQLRVYLSLNVAQGVLQPLTPLGTAALRRVGAALARLAGFPADPARGPAALHVAGERLYVDVTPLVRSRLGWRALSLALGRVEPLSGAAIAALRADPRLAPLPGPARRTTLRHLAGLLRRTRLPRRVAAAVLRPDAVRAESLAAVERLTAEDASPPAGPEAALDQVEVLLDRVPQAILQLIPPALLAGGGSFVLAYRLAAAVGAEDDALLLTRGLPHNPTTEMGLALWSAAVRLRADSEVAGQLAARSAEELSRDWRTGALPALLQAEVGRFLDAYGFRGVAEIDLGVSRWRDDPTPVFAALANYLRLDDPEQGPDAQFRRAAAEAEAAADRIVRRALRSGPLGPLRAALLRLLVRRVRALFGLREAPKFFVIKLFGRCRQQLLVVGAWLAERGRLEQPEDIVFLDLAEARAAVRGADQRALVARRRARYERELRRRSVPRVLLSDGTAIVGGVGAEPANGDALVGTPASPGLYRGPARVVLDPRGARLEPGEVLVAPATDPGWTPLFLTAGALVMEMGGLMSHGAVVARELGIPAVVGVVGATGAIRTGQQVTVDGSAGTVRRHDA